MLDLRQLWNPCAVPGAGGRLVGNDVCLGTEAGGARRCMLLTGPNMGGKSTLLRAACVATIMAHAGCYGGSKTRRQVVRQRGWLFEVMGEGT